MRLKQMYLVYSKNSLHNESVGYIHSYLIAKTREEALTQYKKIIGCESSDDIKLIDHIEGELIGIYNYGHDDNGYIVDVGNCESGDKKLYILEFTEDGEGESYHNYTYLNYSFSLDDILESASDWLENESEDSSDEAVDVMKKELLEEGSYEIPQGRSYCCGFTLYCFDLETELY
jgi:hypothetical protein